MPNPLQTIVERVRRDVPGVTVQITEPLLIDGVWTADITHEQHDVIVDWNDPWIGVSDGTGEPGYGVGPDKVYREIDEAFARVVELLGLS